MPPAADAAPLAQELRETNKSPAPSSGLFSASQGAQPWTPDTVLVTLDNKPQTGADSPLPFFHIIERLKTTKREGYRRFGIENGESISDHMYRMSIITMLCPPSLAARLDLSKCTKMALVHDMAECLVGDITPVDGIVKVEKSRRETETMDYLCTSLLGKVHGGNAGQSIRDLWQEYEDSETLESHFVHDVDKLELLLQMLEYERSTHGKIDMGEFTWVATRIQLPEVKEWVRDVLVERDAFWATLGKVPELAPLPSDMITRKQGLQHVSERNLQNGSAAPADRHLAPGTSEV